MPTGISTTNVANPVLNWLRGTAPSAVAGLYVKLHTGQPGAAGTANASAVTARRQVTMNAASGGAITLASVTGGAWAMTATETISHISVHSDPTAGSFLFSADLTTPRSVVNGDTLTLITLSVSHTPLAS